MRRSSRRDPRRDQRLDGGAQLAPPREQPARRQPGDAGGHAEHEPVGERMQPAAGHHRGPRRGRRRERVTEPDPVGELGGVGNPGEERVRALVDAGQAGERRRLELAAEAIVRLRDLDLGGVGGTSSVRAWAVARPLIPPPTTTTFTWS